MAKRRSSTQKKKPVAKETTTAVKTAPTPEANAKTKDVQIVDFDKVFDTVFGGDAVQLHGVYKYDPELGDFVGNTLIPAVYERYRKAQEKREWLPEDKSKVYVPFGRDNKFPIFLLDLQSKSTTLESAIDQTAKSARGQGLTIVAEKPETKKVLKKWLRKVGITKKAERELFLNLATSRGAYSELAFTSDMDEDSGNTSTRLSSVKFPTFLNYRTGIPTKMGETEFFWYHPNFYTARPPTKKLRGVRAYKDPDHAAENVLKVTVVAKDKETPFYDNGDEAHNLGRFVYQIKDPSLRSESYGMPTYSTEATINAIMVEAAISQLDIASIENGLTVAYFVTVPLIKPREDDEDAMKKYEEAKQDYLDYIQDTLQGAENKDNIVVLFADPRRNHQPIEVAEVPNNNTSDVLEGKYSRMIQAILRSFRITNPALIGSPPETGKGLNNQAGLLAEADDQYYTDFVIDFRELAEEFFEEIIIPLFRKEHNLGEEEEIAITFPRKRRFNTMPSDKILLAVVPTSKIWDLYNLGEFDEKARTELKRDLKDRQIAKAPAVNPSTGEPVEEGDGPDEDE